MQLIDTHVHLNFSTFHSDLDQVAQEWRDAGVVRLVHSCVEPSEFDSIRAIANQYPELSFAVGLHPLDVDAQWTPDAEQRICKLAQSDPRVVAIGETGLDFFKAENHQEQFDAFSAQLRVARSLNLPVIVHCRDAASQAIELLNQFWQSHGSVQGVMHCWSGTPEETQRFLDLGFYISFSGIVTFKNAQQVHESAQLVPDERLLIETDCPFLAPVPHRGKGRNQPSYVRHVAERLAELRNTSVDAIASITCSNACRLFKLDLELVSNEF